MKKIIQILLVFGSAYAAFGQGTTRIAVPNTLANVEGNSSVNDFLSSSSFRMQIVFDASQFAIPAGASGRINSLSFRLNGASSDAVQYVFGGGSVTASTTTRTPDGLSPVFADNVGLDAVTIFNGAVAYGAAYQPGQSPQPFAQNIGATTAFWYMPSQGNLLLDIRGRSGQTLFAGGLDAQSTVGDSISRVFATSELFASGTADSLGLVTRFDFTVVPEPSTWALLIVGITVFGFSQRKWRGGAKEAQGQSSLRALRFFAGDFRS